MAVSHRKLFLPLSNLGSPTPPPLPPMFSNIDILSPNQNPNLFTTAILVFCAGAVAFHLFFFAIYVKKYYLGSNDSSMMNPPAFDFVLSLSTSNSDAGGLRQSMIESIAVFKYKRGDGLIEGTECSVCLNEFQEDENLRLLPKCSHAFHIPCIDTWLSSHKNCPLCRAPILVFNAAGPDLNHSAENLENQNGLESDREGGTNEMLVGDEYSGGFPGTADKEEEEEEEVEAVRK